MENAVQELADRLNLALEARPFEALGPQKTKSGWTIRVFLPGARSITLVDLKTGKPLGEMKPAHPHGLFVLSTRRKQCPLYRMDIEQPDGQVWSALDAYQFAERTFTDFPCDSATLYKTMGAQLCQADTESGPISGVRFAVYAPNARSVSVIGDFNQWDGRRHPMSSGDDGIWRLFVPDLKAGDRYKFELKDAREHLLPHKADPYGFQCTQYPDFHSVVIDHSAYQWQDSAWQQRPVKDPRRQPMSIYEVHAGSWRMRDGEPLNYRQLADELIPYLLDMGFTHVEFMPVSEYPFDGSWGYQPIGLFAPTSRFGSPDDFKYLVDQCHQNGIGVIVDWVPAHFPSDTHGLARFDGTPLYEYEDLQRGWHPDWNSYIYDFGRYTVCDFLISSAMIWLEHFHIDGIRVDAVASMLYLDYSREEGEWTPNVDGGNHNYEAIAFIRRFNETVYGRYPNAMTIAEESTAFDGVTRPVFANGLGFGFKWNMGWMHDTLEYMKRDPIHRRYHHGELTFSMVYGYNENFVLPLSHDEVVHGKGSILDRMPGDEWQQMANLRAYYAFMYAHPGKKLNFMGNELGQGLEWNHRSQLDWYLLEYERHSGVQALFRDLNRLYREQPAMHELDCEPEGFRWINHEDAERSVVSLVRFSKGEAKPVIAVFNLTPTPHGHYRIGVPEAGYYRMVLNTDSTYYGGSNYDVGQGANSHEQPHDGFAHSLELTLPPLGAIFLQPD
ncbi:MAG: 1,4-alpha-glucan branching protein GlgB [Saccharospirillum sp.]